jgi:hypothetical protein
MTMIQPAGSTSLVLTWRVLIRSVAGTTVASSPCKRWNKTLKMKVYDTCLLPDKMAMKLQRSEKSRLGWPLQRRGILNKCASSIACDGRSTCLSDAGKPPPGRAGYWRPNNSRLRIRRASLVEREKRDRETCMHTNASRLAQERLFPLAAVFESRALHHRRWLPLPTTASS